MMLRGHMMQYISWLMCLGYFLSVPSTYSLHAFSRRRMAYTQSYSWTDRTPPSTSYWQAILRPTPSTTSLYAQEDSWDRISQDGSGSKAVVEGESSFSRLEIPSPLCHLVDVNVAKRAVVYEVSFEKDLGIEFCQGINHPVVSKILPNSQAEKYGIQVGDVIIASSATAGDQMWLHDTVASLKSALSTRLFMQPSQAIKFRFERTLDNIPEVYLPYLRVPYVFTVKLKNPVGLHVISHPITKEGVFVKAVQPFQSAAWSGRIEVGDEVLAMSASWGNQLWEVSNVESFVTAIKTRPSHLLMLQFRRMVPLPIFQGTQLNRMNQQQRNTFKQSPSMYYQQQADNRVMDTFNSFANQQPSQSRISTNDQTIAEVTIQGGEDEALEDTLDLYHQINAISSEGELINLWNNMFSSEMPSNGTKPFITVYGANIMMTKAIAYENYELTMDIFETCFGYKYEPSLSLLSSSLASRGQANKATQHASFESTSIMGNASPNKLKVKPGKKTYMMHKSKQLWKDLAYDPQSKSMDDTIDTSNIFYKSKLFVQRPLIESIQHTPVDVDGFKAPKFRKLALQPNVRVACTAMKALSRLRRLDICQDILNWIEGPLAQMHSSHADANSSNLADVKKPTKVVDPLNDRTYMLADSYLFTALLSASSKAKNLPYCEYIFYTLMPQRDVAPSKHTMSVMMNAYAESGQTEKALRLYDAIGKLLKIQSSTNATDAAVVGIDKNTYCTLVKALLSSSNPTYHEVAFDMIDKLPSMIKGRQLSPDVLSIELYNQFLRFYAERNNDEGVLKTLRMMKSNRPRIMPDALSYSYAMSCYNRLRKFRTALVIFHSLSKILQPNGYIYMEALKASFGLHDGLASYTIIQKMRAYRRHLLKTQFPALASNSMMNNESIASNPQLKLFAKGHNYVPQENHYAIAMLNCVTDRKYGLAEALLKQHLEDESEIQDVIKVDAVLANLWIRILLQQNKWNAAMELFHLMLSSNAAPIAYNLPTIFMSTATPSSKKKRDESSEFNEEDDSNGEEEGYEDEDNDDELELVEKKEEIGGSSLDEIKQIMISLPTPNDKTLKVLLKFQLLSKRLGGASKTITLLSGMLKNHRDRGKIQRFSNALFRALSFGLGKYSVVMKEEADYLASDTPKVVHPTNYQMMMNERSDLLQAKRLDEIDMKFDKLFEDEEVDDKQTVSMEGKALSRPINSHDGNDELEDIADSLELLANENVPSSKMLHFLVRALETIGSIPRVEVWEIFYVDLLKALIAENQIKLAQHVIKLYRQGNFQVKIHNLQLVQEAESMVPPLVEQFITTTV